MTIWFDCDGTLVDFYGVPHWLDYLMDSDPYPYEAAKPLMRFSDLAYRIHRLQEIGYTVGIISWLSKNGSEDFNSAVENVKREYLANHLPSVQFDYIHIIEYGTPKYLFAEKGDILFDDEERNRSDWENNGGRAYDVADILNILKNL